MRKVLFPSSSRAMIVVTTIAGLVMGMFAALLGVVSRTGGIDGGSQGLIVSLLCLAVGSAVFVTIGGIIPWLAYAIGIFIVLLVLPTLAASGDQIDRMYTDLITTWNFWLPIAVFGSFVLTVAVLMVTGRTTCHTHDSLDHDRLGEQ